MLRLAINALKGRIMGGDCPRYQRHNPFDVRATFAKLASLVDRTELREVYREALDAWARIRPEDGGHDELTVAEKAEQIATDLSLEKELEDWAKLA